MPNVSSMIDLNDSEILRIERGPLNYMKSKQGAHVPLESFRKAVIEQFQLIGFEVVVRTFETDQAGMYAFDVEISGRNRDAKPFDPDQMAYEVQKNILELPDNPGVIKTDKGAVNALLSGDRPDTPPHSH